MKKTVSLLLALTLLCALFAGCAPKEEAKAEPEKEEAAGGWTVSTESGKPELPEEAQTAFDDCEGEKPEPVALLGTQVVAGLNYAFLCRTEKGALEVVTVYRDLEQKSEITKTTEVDLTALLAEDKALEFDPEELVGGWTVENAVGSALPENAQAAFDKAVKGLTGVGYTPLACLGTQVVAGTNYAILCSATTVTAEPKSALAVMVIYADLNGGAEILRINQFPIA